jgi:hypothetical protein
MDRLLSEQEMAEIDNRHTSPSPYGGVILNMINARKECLASQLAKADKEWVEWVEKLPYEQFDNEGFPTEIDSKASHRCYLIGHNTLQERKRSIGL